MPLGDTEATVGCPRGDGPPLASRSAPSLSPRLAGIDWRRIGAELDAFGVSTTGVLLAPEECASIASVYGREEGFRSRIVMSRHGFGRGEYKYYAYPLPTPVAELREALYPPLADIANRWEAAFGRSGAFPPDHAAYLERCHAAGQARPTPLLLRYEVGDYNCLHQDLYGALAFPLQVAFLLSAPGEQFTGGEFVLTEQRPRMQSRAEVVSLRQGEGVIFPVNQRPVQGGRGVYRVTMRHGVSRLRSGERFTLGIIFHDAA
ncbi:MAG: 2OG-Fe(II) oxygenase [Hyphomicrobiales bacterium]|nr:2OG-Fe(II) oxygenase [Hyphomicrobiales bacterium]